MWHPLLITVWTSTARQISLTDTRWVRMGTLFLTRPTNSIIFPGSKTD